MDTCLFEYLAFGFEYAPLTGILFVVTVAQEVRVRGGKGLDLSKGNGREDEQSQEGHEGEDAH